MKRTDFSNLSIQTQNEKNSYFEHEDFIAGTPPFLRGIYSTMFIQKPLNIQLLVDFSSPKKCNKFIKEHIFEGYKDIILHFNIAGVTEQSAEITSGIIVNSVDDIKLLIEGIPLNELSITLSANNSILIVLGLFIATTKQLDIAQENLSLSVVFNYENSIINNKYHKNSIEDILVYTHKNLSNFNSISISPFKTSEDSSPENELAYFLAATFEHITHCISKGMLIDNIASKLSLNIEISDDHFLEISKMRAARILWIKMLQQFQPKDLKSQALQINSHTNFSNNFKVLSAIMGGSQSVISSNSIFQVINEETFITKTVDPWAGSTSIEKQTEEIVLKTWQLFLKLQKNDFSENPFKKQSRTTEFIKKNEINLIELVIESAKKRITLEELNALIDSRTS